MSFKFGSDVKPISSGPGDLKRHQAGQGGAPQSAFSFSKPSEPIHFDLPIGNSDQQPFGFNKSDRAHHTHIIGSTGTGKSKFIELLIRHDAADRDVGLCLIDPHGSLYDDVLRYLALERPDLADRIVLFNPARETEHIIGFNPVVSDGEQTDYLLDSLISACLKAWGQDDTDRTPRITKWLENIFYTIMCNDLTLVESAPLLSIQNKQHRETLLRNVHNDMVLDDWRMFEVSSNTQKQALIEGAANRLRKFLRNGMVRDIIGQKERVLDFSEVMAEGKIVLVNLNGQGTISHENTKLLGILLVNEIFRCAKLRDPSDPNLKPFYFYIDEFAQFITRDIARALEEARKFKLFMVLAHQHLAQLREEDEYLYASVLTNCKNKVVFGGLSREDAKTMANEVATGFVNLKSVKDEIYSTKARQRLEKRTVRNSSVGTSEGTSSSESHGHSTGRSFTDSESYGEHYSESIGSGLAYRNQDRPLAEDLMRRVLNVQEQPSGWNNSRQQSSGRSRQTGYSETSSYSDTYNRTTGRNHSRSQSQGESETWVSVNEEYRELSSRTFWSLQELEYMQMAKLKNQGVAQAFVKLWEQEPRDVTISNVNPPDMSHDWVSSLDAFRGAAIKSNGSYFTSKDQLEIERHQRQIGAFGEPLKFSGDIIEVGVGSDQDHTFIDDDDPFN